MLKGTCYKKLINLLAEENCQNKFAIMPTKNQDFNKK